MKLEAEKHDAEVTHAFLSSVVKRVCNCIVYANCLCLSLLNINLCSPHAPSL